MSCECTGMMETSSSNGVDYCTTCGRVRDGGYTTEEVTIDEVSVQVWIVGKGGATTNGGVISMMPHVRAITFDGSVYDVDEMDRGQVWLKLRGDSKASEASAASKAKQQRLVSSKASASKCGKRRAKGGYVSDGGFVVSDSDDDDDDGSDSESEVDDLPSVPKRRAKRSKSEYELRCALADQKQETMRFQVKCTTLLNDKSRLLMEAEQQKRQLNEHISRLEEELAAMQEKYDRAESSVREVLTCCVCMEPCEELFLNDGCGCRAKFCIDCFRTLVRLNNRCPGCRGTLGWTHDARDQQMKDLVGLCQ